jgi:hypothetical protein
MKKQRLNEQLYRIHLECSAHWPTTWNLIQTATDNNIHREMEAHYNRLNKKLDQLLHKQAKHPTPPGRSKDQKQFYTRIKNLTRGIKKFCRIYKIVYQVGNNTGSVYRGMGVPWRKKCRCSSGGGWDLHWPNCSLCFNTKLPSLNCLCLAVNGCYRTVPPLTVAARSETWVCGRSPAEIVGSNPTGGMDVCLL